MKITTYEAIVVDGQVRLPSDAAIPNNTTVFVVVPSAEPATHVRLASPRLAHPEQARAFVKEIEEVPADAGL